MSGHADGWARTRLIPNSTTNNPLLNAYSVQADTSAIYSLQQWVDVLNKYSVACGLVLIDDTEFRGTTALITAAAGRGIGQSIARRFAAGGANVVVTDIHPGRTAQVAEAIAADHPRSTVVGYTLDAGDYAQIDQVIDTVAEQVGPIGVLVNNAAVNYLGSIFEFDPAQWDHAIKVNLSGPWYLCRRTMPIMRDAGGGVILNLSSIAADFGGAGYAESPYVATKAGLQGLTRALAHEGGPHGIRVNTISMAVITDTKFFTDNVEHCTRPDLIGPMGVQPQTRDIAEAAAYLASERGRYITGETLNIASGSFMRY